MNGLLDIRLAHFLVLSALVAAAGISTILTKRNAIGILIGVELLLNAAGINLVAFNRYAWLTLDGAPAIDGMTFTVFLIVLAAAEAAVALAIFLNFYNTFRSVDVENANQLRG